MKLRYFIGLENSEVAEALGLSVSTVERYWAYSKAWLFRKNAYSPLTLAEHSWKLAANSRVGH